MKRLYKICLSLFIITCLSGLGSYAATSISISHSANFAKGTSFQEKPKSKKAKADTSASPVKLMFRDLLEYLYFPGIPEEEKEENNSKNKKSPSKKKDN